MLVLLLLFMLLLSEAVVLVVEPLVQLHQVQVAVAQVALLLVLLRL
jgi:hypothetical protein